MLECAYCQGQPELVLHVMQHDVTSSLVVASMLVTALAKQKCHAKSRITAMAQPAAKRCDSASGDRAAWHTNLGRLDTRHIVLLCCMRCETYRQSLQNGLDALQAISDWFLEALEAVIVLQQHQRSRPQPREGYVTLLPDTASWADSMLIGQITCTA